MVNTCKKQTIIDGSFLFDKTRDTALNTKTFDWHFCYSSEYENFFGIMNLFLCSSVLTKTFDWHFCFDNCLFYSDDGHTGTTGQRDRCCSSHYTPFTDINLLRCWPRLIVICLDYFLLPMLINIKMVEFCLKHLPSLKDLLYLCQILNKCWFQLHAVWNI